jgi:hypothetical protein
MALNLARIHAACADADHLIVKARQAALVFRHHLRVEGGIAVAWNISYGSPSSTITILELLSLQRLPALPAWFQCPDDASAWRSECPRQAAY